MKVEGKQLSSLLSRAELDKLVKALDVVTIPKGLDVRRPSRSFEGRSPWGDARSDLRTRSASGIGWY